MEKLFYPALFHKSEEGGFWISFPDFPECFTEGDDMKQAYEMRKKKFRILPIWIKFKMKMERL